MCAAIVSFAFAVSSVSGLVHAQEEDEVKSVLRIGFTAKVDSMNPNVGLTDPAYVFYGLVYDTPQCVDEDLNIVHNLCLDSYVDTDYEPYGSVWVWELTQNAKWHDGERFDADDVIFTINLNADNYAQMWAYQPYAYYMDYAEKVDDYTVRVHYYDRATEQPMAAAYAHLICIPILPEHRLDDWSAADIAFSWEGVFEDSDPPIVGTGPFMATDRIFSEFLKGDKLTLVRNPNYHWSVERDLDVSFDQLELHFYDDTMAMALALENGDLDVAQFPPQEFVAIREKVERNELSDVVTHSSPKCTQYWSEANFNMNNAGPNPSRLDVAVRRACLMATDLDYINDNYYLGLGEPGTTLIPPVNSYWHYEPPEEDVFGFDLAAANALLEESGYRYTPQSPNVRVATADSYAVLEGLVAEGTPLVFELAVRQEAPEEKDIAMYLESEWAKIGVELDVIIMTEAALGALTYGYAYDITIWYWSADPDPMYMLFCQSRVSWNGWSDNMYYDPDYEYNFTSSVREFDEETRRQYVHNCQKIHYEDAIYIVINYVHQTYAWRTDTFQGWGDWTAHPGRSIDNFWTANPLYFDLEYIGEKEIRIPWVGIAIALGIVATVAVAAVLSRMKGKGKKGGGKEDSGSLLGD
jgi:peptide/nickel transport system substrate-binding protein